MNLITKTVPKGTKIYSTLKRACKYQNSLPGGIQPVYATMGCIGFAKLPEKENGVYIHWTTVPTE